MVRPTQQQNKLTNVLPLTGNLVVGTPDLLNPTTDRPVFLGCTGARDSYALAYGGFSTLEDRLFAWKSPPANSQNKVQKGRNLLTLIENEGVILDSKLIGGVTHCLYRVKGYDRDYAYPLNWAQYAEIYYVKLSGGAETQIFTLRFKHLLTGVPPNITYGLSLQKVTVEGFLDLITAPPAKPANTRTNGQYPSITILDARFNLDGSKISILGGVLEEEWAAQTAILINPQNGNPVQEGWVSLATLVDLVILRERAGDPSIFAEMVSSEAPYESCGSANPVCYKLYDKVQHPTIDKTYRYLNHNYVEEDRPGFSYTMFSGGSLPPTTPNRYGGVYVRVNWFGHEQAQVMRFQRTGVIYDVSEVAELADLWSLDYTVVPGTPAAPGSQDDINGVNYYVVSSATVEWEGPPSPGGAYGMQRRTKSTITYADGHTKINSITWYSQCSQFVSNKYTFTAECELVYNFRGTIPVGYSFDVDKYSPTYGSRRLVEYGYKSEVATGINETLTAKQRFSINNMETSIGDSSYLGAGGFDGADVFVDAAEIGSAYGYSSSTVDADVRYVMTVIEGGVYCPSLYVGDKAIARIGEGGSEAIVLKTGRTWDAHKVNTARWKLYAGESYAYATRDTEKIAYMDVSSGATPSAGFWDTCLTNSYPTYVKVRCGGINYDEGLSVSRAFLDGAAYSTSSLTGDLLTTGEISEYVRSVDRRAWSSVFRTITPVGEIEFNGITDSETISPQVVGGWAVGSIGNTSLDLGAAGYIIFFENLFIGVLRQDTFNRLFTTEYTLPTPAYLPYHTGISDHRYDSMVYKLPVTLETGEPSYEMVTVYSAFDSGITNLVTDYPNNKASFKRVGIAVHNATGELIANTTVFPGGIDTSSNPTDINGWKWNVISGYTTD